RARRCAAPGMTTKRESPCSNPSSRSPSRSHSPARRPHRMSSTIATPRRHSGARRRREPGIHNHKRQRVEPTQPQRNDRGYGFRARRCAAPRNDHQEGTPMLKPILSLAFALALTTVASAQDVIRHRTPGSNFPIAAAVEVPAGKTLVYVSGMVPRVTNDQAPRNSIASFGDTKTQTVSVLQTIEAALQRRELTIEDV